MTKYNVTNPTKANHVINSATGRQVLIESGKVVPNVEITDTEAQSMRDTLKKMGDGKFLSLSAVASSAPPAQSQPQQSANKK